MVLFFWFFFCVLCVWGRHSSTCSYPLLQRRRGFLHHIAWLLPKATPAGINLSLASKTTFVQTCCSKKEVSHLQSLPRNFCVDSTLSDFDFWISLFVLPQQHGQLLAPGETFSRTEERVWHILCLSRFSAQGKSGILRWKKHFVSWKEYPKSWCLYISDSCCMLGNTCWLFDLNTLLFILLACLSGFVVWFGLVFSLGCLVCLALLLVSIHLHVWCSVCELDTRELSQEARMKTGTPSFETDWRSLELEELFMAGQPLVSLCKAFLNSYFCGEGTLGKGVGRLAMSFGQNSNVAWKLASRTCQNDSRVGTWQFGKYEGWDGNNIVLTRYLTVRDRRCRRQFQGLVVVPTSRGMGNQPLDWGIILDYSCLHKAYIEEYCTKIVIRRP